MLSQDRSNGSRTSCWKGSHMNLWELFSTGLSVSCTLDSVTCSMEKKFLYQLWLIPLSLPACLHSCTTKKSKSLDLTLRTYSWPRIFLSCPLLRSFSKVNHILHLHVFPSKIQRPSGCWYGTLPEPSRSQYNIYNSSKCRNGKNTAHCAGVTLCWPSSL